MHMPIYYRYATLKANYDEKENQIDLNRQAHACLQEKLIEVESFEASKQGIEWYEHCRQYSNE